MKPNLIFPLASSYDLRSPGSARSGYDQRKVNAVYEVAGNSITGKQTLILAKRGGVVTSATIDDYGSGTQVPYLCQKVNAQGAMPLLIVKDGNDTKAVYPTGVGTTSSVTILASADYAPNYISTVNNSGATIYVLQLRGNASGATDTGLQRTFYSSSLSSWTELSDGVWSTTANPKWGKMAHLGGFSFAQGDGGIWGSALNDVTDWPSDNFIGRTTEQDYPMGLIPYGDQILSFGEETCEHYYNAGNTAGSPLSRVSGEADLVGLATAPMHLGNKHIEYYCYVLGRLFFLGKNSDSYGQCSLMTYNGSVFERVSGEYEEKIIGLNPIGIFSVVIQGQPAAGILLTDPGAETAKWLMFFPEKKSWFEWESTVFSPINSGAFFVGVAAPNKLYVDSGGWTDDGTNYEFLTQFRLPHDDDDWKTMSRCGVQADTVASTLTVKVNDSGGSTYVAKGTLDLSKVRKEMYRCGTYKERYVQLSNTSDKQIRLRDFYAVVE